MPFGSKGKLVYSHSYFFLEGKAAVQSNSMEGYGRIAPPGSATDWECRTILHVDRLEPALDVLLGRRSLRTDSCQRHTDRAPDKLL